jgi:SAM-dependent methyltransferase
MPSPKDIYINCDVLKKIPKLNRENWLKETELLEIELPKKAHVLQVGSMDGTRVISLLEARPDLLITGLEIEAYFVNLAKEKIAASNLKAEFVHGDITDPSNLLRFDYVVCLNNTLAYIPDQKKAIQGMKKLGKAVIISVYGEKFNDDRAAAYFKSIKLEIDHMTKDHFFMKNFTKIRRYSKKDVSTWGGKVTETPIGYFCVLSQ